MKIRNAGRADYTGSLVEVRVGEVVDVCDRDAEYLLSADCPGAFVKVEELKVEKASKSKKGGE